MQREEAARRAGRAPIRARRACIIGIGTGSTVNCFIDALAASGTCASSGAVSSSNASTARLHAAGIEVMDLNEVGSLEVYVDGADEATRARHLIKGGGAALTREKIVAAASRQFICIDGRHQARRPPRQVPVAGGSDSDGARAMWRARSSRSVDAPCGARGSSPITAITSSTCMTCASPTPSALEREINQIVGVVTVGLFAARGADVLIIGTDKGVDTL